MESYRSDSAQPGVQQRVDPAQACHKDDSRSSGGKAQVQEINGHSYMVLKGQGRYVPSPEYPDVFLMENQQQGLLSYMSGSASSTQTLQLDFRSLRNERSTTTQLLNHHQTPEILQPYDPRISSVNVQSLQYHRSTGGPSSPVMVKRARIPVLGVNRERKITVEKGPSVHDPTEYMELYSTSSEHKEWTRVGRVGEQGNRNRPEDERRSRSAESRIPDSEMDVEGSFASRQQKVQVTEIRSETQQKLKVTTERSKAKEKSRSPEREAQTKPDLLKGQQDIPDQPDEKTAKQMMFNYLRQGSSDSDDVISERVHMLKSRAAETLEENSIEKQKKLQEELERSEQEQLMLRHKITDMEKELQKSLDQLLQAKRAQDQCRSDMRDLQQQLCDVHDELESTKSSKAGERDRLRQDLSEIREEFRALQEVHEKQDDVLQHRERELISMRTTLEDQISAHTRDVETLKKIHQQEVQELLEATEEAKESLAVLGEKILEVAAEKAVNQTYISELIRTKAELQEKIRASEEQITTLKDIIQQNHNQKNLLNEHVNQLMMEKQNLEVESMEVRQQEEDMCETNQALMRHLEDTQSELSTLNRAHSELKETLQEEKIQLKELQKTKTELEEQMRNQNRMFEQLKEKMSSVVLDSKQETQRLQNERRLLEDSLSCYKFDLNEATMKTQELQKIIQQLEENNHLKLMEVRVCELQKCLTEEHNSSHLLMKTLERGREQMEQVRSDLLQERDARQDLECDKIGLERQNKELQCRVSQLEASQRSGRDVQLSKLQLRIRELEEKLLQEEKEKSDLQQQNRKQERKMKETMLLQDDERLSLQDQRDQLLLRLKSLKRMLDEAEDEIQRLENSKKKLQRDVDEQQEINEQLQTQLSALRLDVWREKRPNTLQTTDEEDDDEEEERAVSSL